ncbi:hypothetical protein [Streptosporangium sp. NPDC051022]|uniref:hypothetical protein n=1 Tax=Streptosporangium sp. NPDC051022 TaxID=3155752 RepID=UPI003423A7CA
MSTTLLGGSEVAFAAPPAPGAATARGWSATWTASPQRPSANYTPNWSEQGFANQTIRQVVRISVGGAAVRVCGVFSSAPDPGWRTTRRRRGLPESPIRTPARFSVSFY